MNFIEWQVHFLSPDGIRLPEIPKKRLIGKDQTSGESKKIHSTFAPWRKVVTNFVHGSIKFDTLSPKQQTLDTQMQLHVELLHRQDRPTDQPWTDKDAGMDRRIEVHKSLVDRPHQAAPFKNQEELKRSSLCLRVDLIEEASR